MRVCHTAVRFFDLWIKRPARALKRAACETLALPWR